MSMIGEERHKEMKIREEMIKKIKESTRMSNILFLGFQN